MKIRMIGFKDLKTKSTCWQFILRYRYSGVFNNQRLCGIVEYAQLPTNAMIELGPSVYSTTVQLSEISECIGAT